MFFWVVVAVALSVGIYFLLIKKIPDSLPLASVTPSPAVSPSPAPEVNIPDDWSTYTSTKYGFSLRYPSDVRHDLTTDGERFYKLGETQSEGTELYDGISVIIRSGSLGEQDFATFVDKAHTDIASDPVAPEVGEPYPVTIAGIKGIAFTVRSVGERTQLYLDKGNGEYLEILNGTVEPAGGNQMLKATADKMISSIRY